MGMNIELTEKDVKEIEMSINFGERLIDYYKATIDTIMSSMMNDNQKHRQYYEADRLYVCDVIGALERGERLQSLYTVKERLTIVGQEFFKSQFRELKKHISLFY